MARCLDGLRRMTSRFGFWASLAASVAYGVPQVLQIAFPALITIGALWLITFPLSMLFLALAFAGPPDAVLELRGRHFDARVRIGGTG